MANNRMLLIHRPTGLAVIIAKHMGWEWSGTPDPERLELLFKTVAERTPRQADIEDFCLGMESCDADTPFVNTDWYGYAYDREEPTLLQVYRQANIIVYRKLYIRYYCICLVQYCLFLRSAEIC